MSTSYSQTSAPHNHHHTMCIELFAHHWHLFVMVHLRHCHSIYTVKLKAGASLAKIANAAFACVVRFTPVYMAVKSTNDCVPFEMDGTALNTDVCATESSPATSCCSWVPLMLPLAGTKSCKSLLIAATTVPTAVDTGSCTHAHKQSLHGPA